jgi:hypothetical protein
MVSKVTKDGKVFIFKCPHCSEYVIVGKKETNCCIFRHGVFKKNGKQVGPHESKNKCDAYKKKNEVYGCCKPFKFNKEKMIVEICGYI